MESLDTSLGNILREQLYSCLVFEESKLEKAHDDTFTFGLTKSTISKNRNSRISEEKFASDDVI